MVNIVEREPTPQIPEGISEHPETFPEKLEQDQQVKVTPKQFSKTVTDDSGQPLIQPAKVKAISITLPSDQQQLVSWAKGPITSSLTWFAVFWLRLIKKAAHFGWKIAGKMVPVSQPKSDS
jgi:hypothetical protein